MVKQNTVANSKILVSILNWNNNSATNTCLKSIGSIASNNQPDVVLIDNHSEQEKLEITESIAKSLNSLKVITNSRNLGFAGGHNESLKFAMDRNYEIVILLNNDTEVIDSNLFESLTLALENNPRAIAAAPTILSQLNPPNIWYGGGKLSAILATTQHLRLNNVFSFGTDSSVEEVSFLTGCCMAINVHTLEKWGQLLPEDYFVYWEDADWCVQAKKAGYDLLYVPTATLLHNVSSSLGVRSTSYIYYNIRNKILFSKRNIGAIYLPVAFLNTLYVSLKYSIIFLTRSPRDIPKSFRTLYYAWFDGFRNKTGEISRTL